MAPPTVAKTLIVGAGPSGLAALKEMREAGYKEVVAVDSRSNFGGVFSPDSNVTFEGLHLTISNMFMAFSDFPPEDNGTKFWSKAEYFDYLSKYVEAFKLRDSIRLKTSVKRAFLNSNNKWEVTLHDDVANVTTKKVVDNLIVATGANHKPRLPCKTQFGNFKGEILHSSQFHSGDQVKGKRVLVVGLGESASDVAHSCGASAASTTVWGRRYTDIAPRFAKKMIDEKDFDERDYLSQECKPQDVLESLTTSRVVRNLPLGVWSVALHTMLGDIKTKYGPDSLQGLMHKMDTGAYSADYFSSDTSTIPTKSCLILHEAAKGRLDLLITPNIECGKSGKEISFIKPLRLAPGTKEVETPPEKISKEFDVIIACTGFELDFDWIEISDKQLTVEKNPQIWFKHCFPPGFGKKLAFLGFARPHSGGIPQCAEILSRYIAQLYLGNLSLPKNYEQIAVMEGKSEAGCYHQSTNKLAVDYLGFMMSMAKLMGCTPKVPWSPLSMVKYWTFPMWPCFFRTQGVGAKPETASVVLNKFGPWDGLAPLPLLIVELLCTFVMPFINLMSLLVGFIFKQRGDLPSGYKWRFSKLFFMYDNSLSLGDFSWVLTQWVAGILIVAHLMIEGVSFVIGRAVGGAASVVSAPRTLCSGTVATSG